MKSTWVPRLALRLLLGGVMSWAGFIKLGEPQRLAVQIANYRLLPAAANQLLAVSLPWVELCAGLLLLLGLWVRPAALSVGLLMAVFAAAVSSALARGLDIECGCFNAGTGAPLGWTTLGLEALLLGASVALYVLTKRADALRYQRAQEPAAAPPETP